MPRALLALLLILAVTVTGIGQVYQANASSQTYTVSKTADTNDGTCNADCSLREAITAANANVNLGLERDVINFNFGGSGVKVISPGSPLPVITGPVEINGLSQTGATCSSHRTLLIQLDGTSAGASDDGLVVNYAVGTHSIIKGLSFTNWDNGIELLAESGHLVECNNIGIDAGGTVDQGNTRGIFVSNATNVVIGGTASTQRNVISGNGSGIFLNGTGSGSTISGNFIGTNEAGTAAIGNSTGIVKSTYSSLTIGGTTAGARNVISGNTGFGINLQGAGSTNVFGNYVGYANNGTTLLANGGNAVSTQGGGVSSGFQIGGVGVGQANKIYSAVNTAAVSVGNAGGGVEGVTVRGNQVRSETIGINIIPVGEGANTVTANDNLDADAGPNKVQNFPVLTSAIAGSPGSIVGTLNSAINTNFQVDFYKGSTCGSAGDRDGETYLGTFLVPTNGSGSGAFNVNAGTFALGDSITATATDTSGNTSEFSACVAATGQVPATFVVNSANDANDGACNAAHCSLHEAIVAANNNNNDEVRDNITFNIPGAGVKTITLSEDLPAISSPVVVDGTTQPGAVCSDATRTILIELVGNASIDHGLIISNVDAPGVLVRGLSIGGFANNGITIVSGADHEIECNNIGLSASGTVVRPNTSGIYIGTAPGTVIGGGSPSKRNVIANNTVSGILVFSDSVAVRGNYFGLGPNGLTSFPNQQGVAINSSTDVIVGGTTPGEANYFGFNTSSSIRVAGGIGSGNKILGNWIGYQANFTPVQTNQRGIVIDGTTAAATPGGGVQVGGVEEGEANRIFAGSGFLAVEVLSTNPTVSEGHTIRGNFITATDTIGIDLRDTSEVLGLITANDNLDPDTGPNLRQNFPVLTTAVGGTPGTIDGSLNSKANAQFTLDFYRGSGTCGQAGTRDGEIHIGSLVVNTNAAGNVTFSASTPLGFSNGAVITATATDVNGSTSEFSACTFATAPLPTTFVVNSDNDVLDLNGCTVAHCSLREAIVAANGNANGAFQDTISFAIPGSGVHVINVTTELPTIQEGVLIDGTSQPGASCQNPGRTILVEIRGPGAQSGVPGLAVSHQNAPSAIQGVAITSFSDYGVGLLFGQGHSLQCSNIGIEADGQTARGNGLNGVSVENVVGVQVGNDADTARNIIGANTGAGIAMEASNSAFIAFNYIGVAGDGVTPRPNGKGIEILGSKSDHISDNVISGNAGSAITLNSKVTQETIVGNAIGYASDATTHVPNGGTGIRIQAGIAASSDHTIGSTLPGAANAIYTVDQPGIEILAPGVGDAIGNEIRANSITVSGSGLGIALTPVGETAGTPTDNDNLDADFGPNRLQNYPVITEALDSPDSISGSFNSTPSTTFDLDFFAGAVCGPELDGERYLGTIQVTTNAAGNAVFTTSSLAAFTAGEGITATATGDEDDTSEFSACVTVVAAAVPKLADSASPNQAVAGTDIERVVTVTGSGFVDGDQLTWNGTPVATTFISATQLSFVATTDLIGESQDVHAVGIIGGVSSALFVVQRSSSDVDCSATADAVDALFLMNVLAGLADANADCPPDADKSGGGPTLADVLHIRREIAGLLEPLASLFQ